MKNTLFPLLYFNEDQDTESGENDTDKTNNNNTILQEFRTFLDFHSEIFKENLDFQKYNMNIYSTKTIRKNHI